MLILALIALIEVINIISFVLARRQERNRGAELIYLREDPRSDTVNYLIAGLLNQASEVFRDYAKDFEGSVIYVDFKQTGYDPELMAQEICRDASWRHGEIRIWAISVGNQAALWTDYMAADIKMVAINPCTVPRCLQRKYQGYSGLAKILQGICEYLLGWISAMPCIPTAGHDSSIFDKKQKYSLMLLIDQLVTITNGSRLGGWLGSEFVILSKRDQFLDNKVIRELFTRKSTKFLEIDADHAGLKNYQKEYQKAFRQTGWTRDESC